MEAKLPGGSSPMRGNKKETPLGEVVASLANQERIKLLLPRKASLRQKMDYGTVQRPQRSTSAPAAARIVADLPRASDAKSLKKNLFLYGAAAIHGISMYENPCSPKLKPTRFANSSFEFRIPTPQRRRRRANSFECEPAPPGAPLRLCDSELHLFRQLRKAAKSDIPVQLVEIPVIKPPKPKWLRDLDEGKKREKPAVKHRKEDGEGAIEGAVTEEDVDEEEEEEEEEEETEVITWFETIKEIAPLALPSIASMMLMFALSVIPLAFVGSYWGANALAGASVGFFILSIAIQYPVFGMTFALDALCSHEYGRAQDSDAQGLYLQRGALINLLVLIPLCTGVLFISRHALGYVYDTDTARTANDFLRYSPLYQIPLILFMACTKFCANQLLPQIATVSMFIGVAAIPFAQRWLSYLGPQGAMLGMTVVAWFQLIVIIVIMFSKSQTRKTFGRLRLREALEWRGVVEYVRLAVPSAIFVASEASAFDMTVLLAARLGQEPGAAWSCTLNISLIFVSVAGGLSAAGGAKVGNALGAGLPADARRYAFTVVALAALAGVVNSAIIVQNFPAMLSLFGIDKLAREEAESILPLIPVWHVADCVQFAFQGVFSGAAQNSTGAVILVTALWGIGIPLAVFLGFFLNLGIRGIVVGLTIGLLVEIPWMVWTAHRLDWNQLAEEAMEDEEDEEDEEEDSPPRK
jgi:putative MATE family efflux protein